MIRNISLGFILLFLVSSVPAENLSPPVRVPRPIADVLKNAHRREKVLIEGKVIRAFDFDTYLVSDGPAEIAVSFIGVKQRIGVGDRITVVGRFDDRSSYKARYGLIQALDWSPASDPQAAQLRKDFGVDASPPVPAALPAALSPSGRSVESRLKELEDLKLKGLVTPEEYQDQRKRILGDL